MKRSKHTLSNYRLLTGEMGTLMPVGLVEVLPGDTIQHSVSALMRLSPLNTPVMHPTNVRIHHFFVPTRLLWDQWEEFITGGPDGTSTPTIPTVNQSTGPNDILGYLGVPPDPTTDIVALPLFAYNKIWNDWYRDQDLMPERGQGTSALAKIAWEKDYFSTARPFTQKGPEIQLPITGRLDVLGIGKENATFNQSNTDVNESDGNTRTYASSAVVEGNLPQDLFYIESNPDNAFYPNVHVDLSEAAQIGVIDFRRGFALQRYQEARARYGSRYTEYLRYLGVRPSDARLQRSEYLGGGSARINFSEVLQTGDDSPGPDSATVGDLFGHGIAGIKSNKYRKFFEEHGYIMTMLSVRPKTVYTNSCNRLWLRKTKEDFFQKELQQIGQQEILTDELFFDGHEGQVFGFQDRYAEYKQNPSIITNDFRDTLDVWHMGRELDTNVTLNQDFIECTPSKRIFQITEGHPLWIMLNHHMVARRIVAKSSHSRIM